ncbi:unnamed protein product [Staurois parvus]|uniref:Uncharacterized protein n=1 Tax=Staurois parvus TaxID=386267 RepID=A0ABN9GV85_9NEOB|nr:unnamed protein product [Staurois parvus]
MSNFKIFEILASSIPRTFRRLQGMEPRRQMPTSTGGDGRGRCRGDIVGAQDKVSAEEIPEQRCSVFPSVARGYRFWY